MFRPGFIALCLLASIIFLSLSCAVKEKTVISTNINTPNIINDKTISPLEKLITDALKEGKITIYSSSGPTVSDAMRNFTKKFGIPVDVIVASGSQVQEKIKRERSAGLYLMDAYMGGPTAPIYLKSDGVWDPVTPLFMPEMVDQSKWLGGELRYLDNEKQFAVAFLSFLAVPLIVNSSTVKQEEIKSYQDLLNPKWKDAIVMNDPSKPSFAGQWFQAFGFEIMNLDYMRALVKQNPTIVDDKRTPVDWIARGKYAIAIAATPEIVKEFIDSGAPLLRLPLMKEVTYASSGGGNIAVMNKRPHPNATKLFVNWLLTKEAQAIFSEAYGAPSAMLGVPATGIDALYIPDPGTKYYWVDNENFWLKYAERSRTAAEIFSPVLKR